MSAGGGQGFAGTYLAISFTGAAARLEGFSNA